MRWALAGLLVGAVLAVALMGRDGGDGDGSARAATPPNPTFVRRCEVGSSVPSHPVNSRDLVVGPLRMMGARQLARARARDQWTPPGTRLAVMKIPVVITGNRAVTVAVSRRNRDVMSLGYAPESRSPQRLADGDRVVRFDVCRPRAGRITGYPGGLVYGGRWKRCVGLEFWVAGRERPVRRKLSLGTGGRCG